MTEECLRSYDREFTSQITKEVLYERLSKVINTALIDDSGEWRLRLLEEIFRAISPLLKQFESTLNINQSSNKPTFIIGPSDSIDDLSFRFTEGEISPTRSYISRESSLCNAQSQVDLANLGPLPYQRVEQLDKAAISSLVKKLKTTNISSEDFANMEDKEIVQLMNLGYVKQRELEGRLGSNLLRAVSLRRMHISSSSKIPLEDLPFRQFDYSLIRGACCENVIGYVPMPTGIAGPLIVNGRRYFIPLTTTEGALVASTNRGCRALTESGGVIVRVYKDAMTRAPVVQLESAVKALELKHWLENPGNFEGLKRTFDATSNYARLQRVEADPIGRLLFIRFEAKTGDAMGMNMVSKGVNMVMTTLKKEFPGMEILSLSGNYCVDKKACALNWIKGRGKSVVSEAVVRASVVHNVLKTDVDSMCRLAEAKLLIGSSIAGTVGGWNAHAANVVAAIFLATGQDAAQVVSSSMCLTSMEKTKLGDLYVSCNMRCLEVGTVGGGTILPAQRSCLEVLGCAGADKANPGGNAKRLAEIICATVMAGELSLMAAQCSDDLIKSHLRLNRSTRNLYSADMLSETPSVSSVRQCSSDDPTPGIQLSATNSRLNVSLHSKGGTSDRTIRVDTNCSNIL
uniref:3-hydroxy-3-methylglutaryl coenzyme A reductase n=1 Tax=Parascaris univalens TaxID=6257 RepID=A0A914ZNA5_PARUN